MTGAMKQCQLLLAIRMTNNHVFKLFWRLDLHVFKLFASFDGIGKDKSYSTPARCVRRTLRVAVGECSILIP